MCTRFHPSGRTGSTVISTPCTAIAHARCSRCRCATAGARCSAPSSSSTRSTTPGPSSPSVGTAKSSSRRSWRSSRARCETDHLLERMPFLAELERPGLEPYLEQVLDEAVQPFRLLASRLQELLLRPIIESGVQDGADRAGD